MKEFRIVIEETHSFSIVVDAMNETHAEDIGHELTLNRNYPYNVMNHDSYEEGVDVVDVMVWPEDDE